MSQVRSLYWNGSLFDDRGGGQITTAGKVRCYQDHGKDIEPGPVKFILSSTPMKGEKPMMTPRMSLKTKRSFDKILEEWNTSIGEEFSPMQFSDRIYQKHAIRIHQGTLYRFFHYIAEEKDICSTSKKVVERDNGKKASRRSNVYTPKAKMDKEFFQVLAELTYESISSDRKPKAQTKTKVINKDQSAVKMIPSLQSFVQNNPSEKIQVGISLKKLNELSNELANQNAKNIELKKLNSGLMDEVQTMKTEMKVLHDTIAELRKKISFGPTIPDEEIDSFLNNLRDDN